MNDAAITEKKYLNCRIPSLLSAVDPVCKRIHEILQAHGLIEICFPVELVVRECLNNAIRHGNRGNPRKTVVLNFRIGRKWVRLQITDEGPAFNWKKNVPKTNRGPSGNQRSRAGHRCPVYRSDGI